MNSLEDIHIQKSTLKVYVKNYGVRFGNVQKSKRMEDLGKSNMELMYMEFQMEKTSIIEFSVREKMITQILP